MGWGGERLGCGELASSEEQEPWRQGGILIHQEKETSVPNSHSHRPELSVWGSAHGFRPLPPPARWSFSLWWGQVRMVLPFAWAALPGSGGSRLLMGKSHIQKGL